MRNKYYEVVATIDGDGEILFGSFVRSDCVFEIEAERQSWKAEGYKAIKIVSRDVDDAPDVDVYAEHVVTRSELFARHAPDFNFELDADALLKRALLLGFVTPIKGMEDSYFINEDY